MLLKRHYRFPEGWQPKRNVRDPDTGKLVDPTQPEGELLNAPPVHRVSLKHSGVRAAQNFSTRLVEGGIAQGWITLGQGKLVMHTPDGEDDLEFTVERGPGYYSAFTHEPIADANRVVSAGLTLGMQFVQAKHPGEKSPDASNPSGYYRLNHYECVLNAVQHKKYRFRTKVGKGVKNG